MEEPIRSTNKSET